MGPGRFTYAALTRRRLVCGWPSVATKRICRGGGLPLFLGEGGLMASQVLAVVPTHWVSVCLSQVRGSDRSARGGSAVATRVDCWTDEATGEVVRKKDGLR